MNALIFIIMIHQECAINALFALIFYSVIIVTIVCALLLNTISPLINHVKVVQLSTLTVKSVFLENALNVP